MCQGFWKLLMFDAAARQIPKFAATRAYGQQPAFTVRDKTF